MQDFLKGIKNLGTKAKSTVKDFFTVTPEEEARGKKPNVLESTTKKMGDFFAPAPDKLRVRDVARELPGAVADVGKEIVKGGARFAMSAGESLVSVPMEINELINPGTKYKVPIYKPEKIPGLGFLGPIESYQNQVKRELAQGEGTAKTTGKALFNIAVDEPVGVAFKPLGLAVGAFIKGGGAKAAEESIQALAKSNAPEEIKGLLGSLGVGAKAADDMAEPLAKATTIDEVKSILGYADNVAPKAAKEAGEAVSRETQEIIPKGELNLKRYASEGFENTDIKRGGTWHFIGDGEIQIGGIGGNKIIETKLAPKNTKTFRVSDVMDRFKNNQNELDEFLGKDNTEILDTANQMISDLRKYDKEGKRVMKNKIVKFLNNNGVNATENSFKWDPRTVIEDLVLSKAAKEKGVDAIILEGDSSKSIFTIPEATSKIQKSEPLYHGTSAPEFDKFNGLTFLTSDPKEAQAFAEGMHLGGSTGGKTRVLEVNAPLKKVKNIDKEIIDGFENDMTDVEVIKQEIDKAIKEGYDTLSFSHPSNYSQGDFTTYVPLSNDNVKILGEMGAKKAIGIKRPPLEAGPSEILGTRELKDSAKNIKTKQQFIDEFAADPSIENIKDKNYDLSKFKGFETPHDRANISSLDPSEYDSWDEIFDFYEDPKSARSGKENIERNIEWLKNNPDKDLPSVLVEGTLDDKKFNPMVLDGHHRVAAYIKAGRKTIPISYDRKTLGEIYDLSKKEVTPKQVLESDKDKIQSIGDLLKNRGDNIVPPEKQVSIGKTEGPERRFITRTKEMEPGVADLLKGKYTPKSNKELIANAEKMVTENYAAAENLARTGTDDQAVAVASRMIEDELNIARKATDEATKTKAYAKAAEIANDAARNLTEAGRAVQAASLLGKMTPEGMARYAARQIQKYNEKAGTRTMKNFLGGSKKIPELNPDQLKDITDAMESINKMEEGTDKARALQKLGEKIQSYIPSTLYEKIINVWKAGLLTGLKTTGVNVASNISHSISEIAKDVPAAAVDKIASLFTGKRTLTLTTEGTGKGAAEGIKKGWDYLKTGFDERNIADKLDYKKVNFGKGPVANVLKKYTDTVFGVLGAEDQPFYYAAKMRSLANQASAMAKNEGLKGKAARDFAQSLIENPTDDMAKYATLDAETAVFQQDSWLANKAQNLKKGLELILPFAKTPANVANAMINYSPVGIVKTIIENIGKGRFDQRLFSQGMGRGITGTGALAIGSALMSNKLMNLSTPTSEKERKQWELEGRIPNSIKVGGEWRNIGVLGPIGMVLIVGGHLRKGMDETGSFAGGLAQAAAGFGSALTEQSFLSGVNKAIDAIKDPNRSFNGFASSLAGSIIPTLVGDIARGTDQYERRTDGMIERIQSRIPGARQGLEPQVDTFGKPKETPNFLEVMADPTRPGNATADANDPVVIELRRLMDAEYPVTPTQLGPTAGYKSLTPEQNTYLWKLAGQAARMEVERVMKSKQYGRYDDEQKSQVLDKAVTDVKTEARARVVAKALEGLSDSEQKSKLAEMKDEGLLTRSVFDIYLSLKRKR